MLDLSGSNLEYPSATSEYRKSTASKKLVEDEKPARWGAVPPKEYIREYGTLPVMSAEATGAERLSNAFGTGAAAHNAALIDRKAVTLFPGVRSFDEPFLLFLRALSEEFNSEFPVDLDENGFTTSGIHTTFDRLRCPSGYFQSPMSYTAVDNSEYRTKELGLSAGYTPRQRAIAVEAWKLVWSQASVSKVNVPKISTSGARRFTYDVQWKLAYVQWLMDGDRFERMLNAVDKADWLTLANEFETLYMTYIQKRGQVDTPGKQRMVFDKDYALYGKGKPFPADKDVVINGVKYSDFSAVRARVVHAGPWVINCFLQMVSSPTMKSLFSRWPDTFHVNTGAEIKAVVDGKYVMCSDVTEYDRSMSRDSLEVAHETMKEFWDERLVKASWRLVTSPYYAKPLEVGGKGGSWILDPTDWSQEVFAGNRSGHALTSLFAKVNKVIDTLIVIDQIYPVLGRVDAFLSGTMPMGMINNGDDEVVWAHNLSDMERFRTLRAKPEVGHYIVKPEDGQGFSGLLLCKAGDRVYDPRARIHTTFEKLWCNERSIGGKHRAYWPIGTMVRIDTIMATELGRKAWAIHMRLYRDMLAPIYGDFTQILMRSVAEVDLRIESLTWVDKEVIDSPDKIHHKYTPEEVSDVVLEKITSKVPEEVVESFLVTYYKGHLS